MAGRLNRPEFMKRIIRARAIVLEKIEAGERDVIPTGYLGGYWAALCDCEAMLSDGYPDDEASVWAEAEAELSTAERRARRQARRQRG